MYTEPEMLARICNKQAQVYIRDKNFRTETLPCVFVNCIDLHSILRRRQYATLLETRQTPIVKDEETDALEEGATRQMSVILARLDLFSLPFFLRNPGFIHLSAASTEQGINLFWDQCAYHMSSEC